jgi:hypothetical protein
MPTTPEQPRTIVVDPQPFFPFGVRRIVRVPDPFHDDAFQGTPAEGHGAKGERELVWWCEDFAGNLVARWADAPPCPFGDEPCSVLHRNGLWTWVREDLPVFGKMTGVVLEPGEFTAEQIQEIADAFTRGGLRTPGLTVLESWVTPRAAVLEGTPVRAGAWLMRVAVHDEKLWSQMRLGGAPFGAHVRVDVPADGSPVSKTLLAAFSKRGA